MCLSAMCAFYPTKPRASRSSISPTRLILGNGAHLSPDGLRLPRNLRTINRSAEIRNRSYSVSRCVGDAAGNRDVLTHREEFIAIVGIGRSALNYCHRAAYRLDFFYRLPLRPRRRKFATAAARSRARYEKDPIGKGVCYPISKQRRRKEMFGPIPSIACRPSVSET